MGKYQMIKSEPENDLEWITQVVANELAEANRLTILKMKINHGIITSKKDLRGELVDKA